MATRARVPVRSPRRKSSWANGPGQEAVQAQGSSGGKFLFNLGQTSLGDGQTVIRIRGVLTQWLVSAASAQDGFTGAFGIGTCTAQAFAAGAASCPGPITERDWDGWMYWHAFSLKANNVMAAGNNVQAPREGFMSLIVDTKAMRKTEENITVFAAAEYVEVGTAVVARHFDSRMLFLIP